MDVVVVDVLHLELLGRCPDVALFEEVQVQGMGEKSPHSDIEFTFLNQEGSLYVFLYYKRAGA